MCKRIISYIIGLAFIFPITLQGREYNEADTCKVMTFIRENFSPGDDPGKLVGKAAEYFTGTPVEDVIKNDSTGEFIMTVSGFDDISFLNMVAALSRLSTSPGHKRIYELEKELENLSYRRGEAGGFANRMVYLSDWVVDNKSRNNVRELTESYSDQFRTKSLEKVSRSRMEYKALKDSATYEAQKMVEMGFRTHKVPHLKREQSSNKEILSDMRDGDIIVLLTPEQGTDALEIGVVREREDGFHLIHPSRVEGKVVEEKETLDRYIKRNAKRTYGWRWLRLAK